MKAARAAELATRGLVLFFLCLSCSPGAAMDRSDLSRVLEKMPPNGPLWQYGNVTLQSRTKPEGAAPVTFAHWSHRARYACRVCHLELGFSMRAGGSGITRKRYLAGEFCGACHDGKTAFSTREDATCGRCHLKDLAELEKRFEAFAARFPVTRFGNGIDWALALRKGQIKPVLSLETRPGMPLPEKLRRPLRLGTTSPRSSVPFSHEEHFLELDCSSCHPDLFNIQKKGTKAFTMSSNIFGEFCGGCHMLVAFPMNDCRRCHREMSSRF